ncbi:MAG: hypothetical protein KC505_10945 [Myxococcales bacterium]|nr:hypothetical protein [Myxococcales bacterium]USN49862.1 MAG: hypothetical protein H6731_06165 [Myxococcales bacterium]
MKVFFLVSFCFCVTSWSETKHISNNEIGEYLEYDLERNKAAILKREAKYHGAKIIKAPLIATRKINKKVANKISQTKNSIKLFFSSSRSVSGNRSAIPHALENWQSTFYYNDYRNLERRDQPVSLMSIAGDSWYLLKRSLYTAGVVLPRESWRTLKSLVYGAFNIFID